MKEFEDINYSIWCDFIERDFLENRFQEIINDEVIKVQHQILLFLKLQLQVLLLTNSNLICYKQMIKKNI